MFDHKKLNLEFIQKPENRALNYGVRIVPYLGASVFYWKCIGVYHLLPKENKGNHNIYLETLDELGQRVQAYVRWTWVGKKPSENAPDKKIDKPLREFGADIALHGGQNVSMKAIGLNPDKPEPGETVENIHTSWPDEPGGNQMGHHSFYVVFQKVKTGSTPPIIIPPVEPPIVFPPIDPKFTQFIPWFENERLKVTLMVEVK